MNKIIYLLILGIIIISSSNAISLNNSDEAINVINNLNQQNFTHTVFGEYGTTSWCDACKYAHGALMELFTEDQFSFYYISLVADKNPLAEERAEQDYNKYGWPVCWFDGGYLVNLGASSLPSVKANYINSINDCGIREVKDITIDLSVLWLGGTTLKVNVSIYNNESNTYDGSLRVYITEKISSMDWKNTQGQLYTFPFLDYAFNTSITIPTKESFSDSMTWDGESNGFSTITENNIMIFAAVYNDEWHQGYSFPPDDNPFDAYYLDDSLAVSPGDNWPPNIPETPNGPTSSLPNRLLTYTSKTDNVDWWEQVYFMFDWDDGTYSNWIGPFYQDETVEASHKWEEIGNYKVKVKAKDNNGYESDWSDQLVVTIPRFKSLNLLDVLSELKNFLLLLINFQ